MTHIQITIKSLCMKSGMFLEFIVNHRGIEANTVNIRALIEMSTKNNQRGSIPYGEGGSFKQIHIKVIR